ncbi:MAG TPA: helix-turn-helix domain-containing protein [Sporichthya sp.]|jgi:DNA-binding HxlR family transcriptional regulator|nr:helix-turn-helix domain-containing protein [Sporichthya sp.]
MGASYGQFCPVAKAMELLDERWTLLVVRELLFGSTRFNEIRRGVPRMSPALLSTRLAHLARAGVIERRTSGRDVEYVLTPAGRELGPVVEALGMWGARWAGNRIDNDYDPKLLMWDMHRNVDHPHVPPGRTVVHFRFPEIEGKGALWWMTLTPGDADVCDYDPGHDLGVTVTASLRALTEVWLGERSWKEVQRSGEVEIDGPSALRRALPTWFLLAPAAAVPRPSPVPRPARA